VEGWERRARRREGRLRREGQIVGWECKGAGEARMTCARVEVHVLDVLEACVVD